MSETILFCIVFLSQVLLISWLYPRRVIHRGRYVLENFPPATHPKAYPQPVEVYQRWLRNIARLNNAIVFVGVLIIALILASLVAGWDGWIFSSSRRNAWVPFIVAPFFIVQMVAAVMYINFSAGKLLLAMKDMPPPRVRTAELHRRRLFDFVSPTMLTVAVLTNVAFIAFVLYSHQRTGLPLSLVVAGIASVVVSLLASAAVVRASLRAPKLDPYQAHQDRHDALKLVVRQELTYCIAFPMLFATFLIVMGSAEPAVITSLFMQGIALASLWHSYSYRVETIDFDVYRQDAHAPMPDVPARTLSP